MRALYYDANDEQQGECEIFSIVIAAIFIIGIGALATLKWLHQLVVVVTAQLVLSIHLV